MMAVIWVIPLEIEDFSSETARERKIPYLVAERAGSGSDSRQGLVAAPSIGTQNSPHYFPGNGGWA